MLTTRLRARRVASPLSAALLTLASVACSTPDPDKLNRELAGAAPLYSASLLEVVVELPAPPGNLTVAGGRVLFSFHPEAQPSGTKVARLEAEGWSEFPSAAWQQEREGGPFWITPLALRTDSQGWVWILDHGDYGDEPASISAFDPQSGELLHRHVFADQIAPWGSLLNDFAVDAARGFIYIADTGPFSFSPGIVVYQFTTGAEWRVLEEDPSVEPLDHHTVVQGRFMRAFGLALQLGVDSIALSADGQTLVYGPLSGDRLYSIATELLRQPEADPELVARSVRPFGPKPASDGITMDRAGRVYLTAIERDGLARLDPAGAGLELLVQDAELLGWPDGVALDAEERYLYASVSELHRVIGADLDELPKHAPFRIVRFPLPGAEPATEPAPAPNEPTLEQAR